MAEKEYIERETTLARVDAEFFKTDPSGEEQLGFLKCRRIIRELPAADVVEVDGDITILKRKKPTAIFVGTDKSPIEYIPVVRCKDCRHYSDFDPYNCKRLSFHICKKIGNITKEEDFCSYGERKEATPCSK